MEYPSECDVKDYPKQTSNRLFISILKLNIEVVLCFLTQIEVQHAKQKGPHKANIKETRRHMTSRRTHTHTFGHDLTADFRIIKIQFNFWA